MLIQEDKKGEPTTFIQGKMTASGECKYGIGVRFEGQPSTNWDYFSTDGGITNNPVDAWWSYDVMHTRKQMEILKKSWKNSKFWLLIDS